MSDHSVHERVYEDVLENFPPYVPREPWNVFTRKDDLRQPIHDRETVLENLRKRFSVDDLVKTGVAELMDDGVLTLSRLLSGPARITG